MMQPSMAHPNFIGIGSARCGSTWLAERLRHHPQVWIPPIKEIHYFDMQKVLPWWHWIRMRRRGIHLRRYLAHHFNEAGRMGWRRHDLIWGIRYFLGRCDDRWYRRVLEPPEGAISGEITPAYSLLDDEEFAVIARDFPKTRFIYTMRDPIDRDWSQVVMHLGLHRRGGDPARFQERILEVLDRPAVVQRSSYLETLRRLDRLPRDRFRIYFFDQIRDSPVELLEDLCEFLQLEPRPEMVRSNVERKVAARDMGGRRMPESVERFLAARWLPMLETLERRFDGPVRHWRERASRVLEGRPA